MSKQRDLVYIAHILECIAHILECIEYVQAYTKNGKESFINESLVQDAVLRRLQIMAESTQRLSEEIRNRATDIDWRGLSGFRNILIHDYLGGIDLDRVWDAIANDLSSLEQAMKQIARELNNS